MLVRKEAVPGLPMVVGLESIHFYALVLVLPDTIYQQVNIVLQEGCLCHFEY